MKVVIDTNVLLVANRKHAHVSDDCVKICIQRLQEIQKKGVVVIDDGHRVLDEYLQKTSPNSPKGVGDVFLKWLLRHAGNVALVEQVSLTEHSPNCFAEFPVPELEIQFDPSDRKFAAIASAHQGKPSIWQAADSKWLDWWPALHAVLVSVDFLCPHDVCHFYLAKFPNKAVPALPDAKS